VALVEKVNLTPFIPLSILGEGDKVKEVFKGAKLVLDTY